MATLFTAVGNVATLLTGADDVAILLTGADDEATLLTAAGNVTTLLTGAGNVATLLTIVCGVATLFITFGGNATVGTVVVGSTVVKLTWAGTAATGSCPPENTVKFGGPNGFLGEVELKVAGGKVRLPGDEMLIAGSKCLTGEVLLVAAPAKELTCRLLPLSSEIEICEPLVSCGETNSFCCSSSFLKITLLRWGVRSRPRRSVNGVVAASSLDFVGSRTFPGEKGVVGACADVSSLEERLRATVLGDVLSGWFGVVTNLCLALWVAVGVLSKKVMAGVGLSVFKLVEDWSWEKKEGIARNTGFLTEAPCKFLVKDGTAGNGSCTIFWTGAISAAALGSSWMDSRNTSACGSGVIGNRRSTLGGS